MSAKVLAACWDAPLDAFCKGVLLALSDCADSLGACNIPSASGLSARSGVPEYLISAVIAELKRRRVLIPLDRGAHGRAWQIDVLVVSGLRGGLDA